MLLSVSCNMSHNVSYNVSCNVLYNVSYNVSCNVLYNVLYNDIGTGIGIGCRYL